MFFFFNGSFIKFQTCSHVRDFKYSLSGNNWPVFFSPSISQILSHCNNLEDTNVCYVYFREETKTIQREKMIKARMPHWGWNKCCTFNRQFKGWMLMNLPASWENLGMMKTWWISTKSCNQRVAKLSIQSSEGAHLLQSWFEASLLHHFMWFDPSLASQITNQAAQEESPALNAF